MQTRLPKLWWNDKEKQKEKKAKPTTTKNKKLVNIQRHKAQIPTQSGPRSSIPYEERILFNILIYSSPLVCYERHAIAQRSPDWAL